MDLILVQHGEAVGERVDRERPLTPRGREDVERVARAAAARGIVLGAVRHSGKRRAAETAAILARHLAGGRVPEEMTGLAPRDDPRLAAKALHELPTPLALAGHMPHLSRLASLLVIEDPEREIVAFQNAGLVALGRFGGRWRVAWVLTPDLVE